MELILIVVGGIILGLRDFWTALGISLVLLGWK